MRDLSDGNDSQARAHEAFRKRDYELALKLSEQLDDPASLFRCGILYETGFGAQTPDLDRAWRYFERLMREHQASEGYLGCARIILKRARTTQWAQAEAYCLRAIELDGNAFAYFLLGETYSRLKEPLDCEKAARAFVSAAMRGAPWGWRRYANIKIKQGNWPLGVVVHCVATIAFPLYILLLGKRATRTG